MFLASMIFQVEPNGVDDTRKQLDKIPELSLHGLHDDDVIVAVAETEDEQRLQQLSERIIARYESIKTIYPTFLEFGTRRIVRISGKKN